MSIIKKFFLSALSFLILFTYSLTYFSVPKVSAQDTFPWYNQSFPQWYNKVYDEQTSPPQEIFGERYTAAQVQWVIYSLIAFIPRIAGQGLTCIFRGGSSDNCIAQNPLISEDYVRKPLENKSVFATLFNSKSSLSGVNYVREKLASLHVIPQVEAQTEGFGFGALNPVRNIWRICRDIMYGFFVLIIIIFAFMIMFRVKLNPQTVVSVQSAIPKIIITLILVTFSYAIAGLMVDLMYVVIGILALIFRSFGFVSGASWAKIFELLTSGPGVGGGSNGILGWIMGYWWNFVLALFGSLLTILTGGFGLTGGAFAVIGIIIGVFLVIGVLIWLVIISAKVFILLIKTYIMILISVIFAPFIIGFGAILPTGGFNGWLKGLVSNLLIYPLAGGLILLSVLFLSGTTHGVRTSIADWIDVPRESILNIFEPAGQPLGQYWYPPLTLGTQNETGRWDPLPILWTFASLGILAMVPKSADIIKGLMSGRGTEGMDSGIGAAFGAIGGYALGTARTGGGAFFNRSGEALQRRIEESDLWLKDPSNRGATDYATREEAYLKMLQRQRRYSGWRRNIKV